MMLVEVYDDEAGWSARDADVSVGIPLEHFDDFHAVSSGAILPI